MTEAATTREPFTDVTWDSVGTLKQGARLGWMAEADLAYEAAEKATFAPQLTVEDWRVLISAAQNGMPVYMSYTHSHPDGRTHRTTDVVVVRELRLSRHYDGLRIGRWGFGTFPVTLMDVERISVPHAVYDFDVREV